MPCDAAVAGLITEGGGARNVDVVFRFARDSLLEGAGFEPSVPPQKKSRRFESGSLQRRVECEPGLSQAVTDKKAEHAARRPAFRTSPRCSHHRNMSLSAIRWPRFIPKRNAIHCSGGVLALRSVIPRCTSAPHRPRLRPPPESRRRYSRPRGHCPEIDLRPAYVRSVTCPYRCLSQVSDFEQCCRNDLSGL
jgi:hypothetical protein